MRPGSLQLPALALALTCAACSGAAVGPDDDDDAGLRVDAGRDTDEPDAGPDAIPRDAGNDPDAGFADAGSAESTDAGSADAGELPQTRAYPWTTAPPTPPEAWLETPPDCSSADWLAKYFRYRTRFRGDGTGANPGFISIGPGPGESIPASIRTPTADCATDWWVNDSQCRQLPAPGANGKLGWGDATIWQGWYLMMLASEHAAFRRLGVPTDRTEAELHHALQAFNRLDEVAETYFGRPPLRDGFFIRDDVTQELVFADPARTRYRFPRDDGLAGYGCILSTSNCGQVTTAGGAFESQDQVIGLLPGLALVAALVPAGVTVDGVPIAHEAKAITHRMVNFLREHGWKVVDPTGEIPPNEWGGSAVPFSNQIAKCANFITGNAFGIPDYRNALSQTAGATLMAGVDASWFTQNLSNQSMSLKLVTVSDEWGETKLAARAADWSSPVFPMINALLHGRGLPAGVTANEVETMLSSAPCGGPCHRMPGCEEAPGWRGEHRFKSPEERNGNPYGIFGEYGGMDYLLLHNLYVLLRDGRSQVGWATPPLCRPGFGVQAFITSGAAASTTYDPWISCNRNDFGRDFCGRTFAGWLDAAYHGEATIHVAGGRFRCEGDAACVVEPSAGIGSAGTDLFIGSNDADMFEGGGDNDCLVGFDGADVLKGGAGRDTLLGLGGDDTLCGESCSALDLSADPDVLFGGEGNDLLEGGPASDEAYGGPGHDRLTGGGGRDLLEGEDGNDDLDGEAGIDTLHGGPGDDRLRGGLDDDLLYGDQGRDKLDGAAGDDTLNGDDGDDFLLGGEGEDSLSGGPGADRLCGGCGEDALNGGWDADACRGEAANLCFTNTSNTVTECESDASRPDCRDDAFDAW